MQSMLQCSGGNLAAAAREAGLDRAQFYRMAKHLGLTPGRVHC